MKPYLLPIATVVLLSALSLLANWHFRAAATLPMQWGLNGAATWSAPRPLALAFTPLLAAFVLAFTTAAGARGQTGLLCATLVVVHLVHLAMIQRALGAG